MNEFYLNGINFETFKTEISRLDNVITDLFVKEVEDEDELIVCFALPTCRLNRIVFDSFNHRLCSLNRAPIIVFEEYHDDIPDFLRETSKHVWIMVSFRLYSYNKLCDFLKTDNQVNRILIFIYSRESLERYQRHLKLFPALNEHSQRLHQMSALEYGTANAAFLSGCVFNTSLCFYHESFLEYMINGRITHVHVDSQHFMVDLITALQNDRNQIKRLSFHVNVPIEIFSLLQNVETLALYHEDMVPHNYFEDIDEDDVEYVEHNLNDLYEFIGDGNTTFPNLHVYIKDETSIMPPPLLVMLANPNSKVKKLLLSPHNIFNETELFKKLYVSTLKSFEFIFTDDFDGDLFEQNRLEGKARKFNEDRNTSEIVRTMVSPFVIRRLRGRPLLHTDMLKLVNKMLDEK